MFLEHDGAIVRLINYSLTQGAFQWIALKSNCACKVDECLLFGPAKMTVLK